MGMPEYDIIDDNFFQKDAFPPHLFKDDWSYLEEHGVQIYKSAAEVFYKKFPPIVTRDHIDGGTVIAPKKEWNSILIPFSPLDHDEQYFKGKLISDILYPLIKGASNKKKFIASCRSWYCFFAEMNDLSYETIFKIAGSNEIIPFILYDETMSYCFGIDFDFEYSFFSSADLKKDDPRLYGTFSEWDSYFIEKFVRNNSEGTNNVRLFEKVLRPSLGRELDF